MATPLLDRAERFCGNCSNWKDHQNCVAFYKKYIEYEPYPSDVWWDTDTPDGHKEKKGKRVEHGRLRKITVEKKVVKRRKKGPPCKKGGKKDPFGGKDPVDYIFS